MKKRNWLVEDNLVAFYVALYEYKDLNYELEEIEGIVSHKGFPMRIQQFIAIKTKGRRGLDAGLKSPLFKQLYDIFIGHAIIGHILFIIGIKVLIHSSRAT